MTPSDQSTQPRRSDATRAAILRAARERFAADGYERATIRAIAADAQIDPSMVMRYYGSKEGLFAAAAEFDLRLPDLTSVPPAHLGEALVRHFLARWEGDETLVALLRAASTNPGAAERMRGIFADQLTAAVATFNGDPALTAQRAGLVASQILGLAFTRYIVRLPPMVDTTPDELVSWIAPTLQRYLTGTPPS
ncbi:TetR family transcriptional regulator [Micromonospora vinacea]|uniref:AcrR family transcriptional regulator n=1 Tax=Micromonospora vinacea TaxID=709878 RepID=A0ABS0JYL4_9ACTN|nr:TetR family transcriptional regulator [Micromonospora vinacea]MBG6101458.1 AcrR family transcriptional regulator [Micromonospora vinacea]WSZ75701.1 TetR family transcriptional regulator [Micromonospora sp. NBC_00860]WTA67814.1 TetR family transcriptional regulator [Micromonospora sp. NBC_00855]